MMSVRSLLVFCPLFCALSCGSDTTQSRYVGGQVQGLSQGSLTLGATDGQSVTVTQNSRFTLPKAIAQGESYSVFVLSAPQGQSCTVQNATGVIGNSDVTDITVSCDLAFGYYTVGGQVTGLSQSQTTGLVLAQGQERLAIAADGAFVFATPLTDLSPYAVGIAAMPVGQNCQIQGAQGFVDAGHIKDVVVACAPSPAIFVTVAVSGLVQDPNAQSDVLSVVDKSASATSPLRFGSTTAQAQRFARSYTYGASFVLQLVSPSGMQCTWDAGGRPTDPTTIQGVLTGNTSLEVSCVPELTYTLSVEVAGITQGTLLASNRQSTDVNSPMAFDLAQTAPKAFGYGYTPGQLYDVVIAAPPGQSCVPTAQSPSLTGLMTANTTLSLVCTQSPAKLSVGVSGVTRGSVSISNGLTQAQDANSPLVFTAGNANATQYFAHSYAAGQSASLSLSASALACYFAANGGTSLQQTLMGDTFVAVVCAQTIP